MSELSPLLEALKAGDTARVESLLTAHPEWVDARREGTSLLMLALYYNKPDIAKAFARRRASLDLFEAAALGRSKRVAELLAEEPSLATAYAPDGFTALGLAAFFGQPEVVRLLIERGADVNAASRNGLRVAPLHSAVARRSLDATGQLLAAGADPNARQQGGVTPLHGAAAEGDLALTQLLIQHGADPRARDEQSQSPLHLAEKRGHRDVYDFLESVAPTVP